MVVDGGSNIEVMIPSLSEKMKNRKRFTLLIIVLQELQKELSIITCELPLESTAVT